MSKKDNISSFQIAHSKIWADGEKYFSLFEKHIPILEAGQKVLVYDISNLEFICKLMSLNKDAEFWIYGNQEVNEALPVLGKSFHEVVEDPESKTYNIPDMKFDCIIMNPPYERNLHLKILAEAITHLKNETSTCVNLSPVRWLQDPLAKYKKNCDLKRFEESVAKHIESLETVSSKDGAELFNNRLNVQCGIYCCTKNGGYDYIASNSILDKVLAKKTSMCDSHIVYSRPIKYSCVITLISGGAAGNTEAVSRWMMDKKKAFYNNDKNADGLSYKEYRDKIIWGNLKAKSEVTHIEFDNSIERENFYNSQDTLLMRYIFRMHLVDVHVHPEFLPWLGDSINPRTGKKGYEGEWTDSDFYTFFNIMPDEQEIIESTMEKYK